jgi:hypothetical protein
VKVLAGAWLTLCLLILASCGGGRSSPDPTSPLSGNWQLTLNQNYPVSQTTVPVSGFLVQSSNALSGSVQVPLIGEQSVCGGLASLTGTLSGQSVTFSLNVGGTTLSFTGTIASDNLSMSGDYQGQAGACFARATSGTWNAFVVPPLNGKFTGTIDSTYMAILKTGQTAPPFPVAVSGNLTQGPSAGASATVTGTITAVGYPCFATASLSGTISGQNVYLSVFGYDGQQIGTIGSPSSSPPSPALVLSNSNGISLVANGPTNGLTLGGGNGATAFGPCPAILNSGISQPSDYATVSLAF